MAAQLTTESEETSSRLSSELERLRAELIAVQKDRDQQLLLIEHDHQQVNTRDIFYTL